MAMHHGHEAVPDEAPCASSPASCDLAGASVDARTAQLKVKDASELPVAIVAEPAALQIRLPEVFPNSLDPPDIPASAPPVRVLFCVYLK